MTTGQVAAQYRGYAAKCLLLAQNQTVDEKLALIDMAQAWITLAEQVDKNESLLVIHETCQADTEPIGGELDVPAHR